MACMALEIQLVRTEWYTDHEDGLDGAVWYDVWRDGAYFCPLRQPFTRNAPTRTKAGSCVWHWDGDHDAPTLDGGGVVDSSYLAIHQGVRIHFHLVRGKIEPLEGLVVRPN